MTVDVSFDALARTATALAAVAVAPSAFGAGGVGRPAPERAGGAT